MVRRPNTQVQLYNETLIYIYCYKSLFLEIKTMSDPTLSDIDFKNEMALVWTTLVIQLNIDSTKYKSRIKIQN